MATDIPGLGRASFGVQGKPLERMREELQILLGVRGDPLDAALTLRSAIERGLIDRIGNALTGNVTYVNTFPTYTGGGGTAYVPDLTPPPPVSGLTVVAGFSQVIVQFDAPTYTQGHGNLRTDIYAIKRTPGDPSLPTFDGSTPLATSAQGALNIVSLPSELNTRWHVWAKHVTVDGVESTTVAGGVNGYNVAGAFPTTGQDITQLLTLLTGQIAESQLATTLAGRIALVDASSSVAGSVNARLQAEADARAAAIAAVASVGNRTFYSATEPVSDMSYTLMANDTWVETDNGNRRYRYSGSAWVEADDARIGQAVTDIANETINRISSDGAEAAARESLYTGLGGAQGTDYKVFNQPGTPSGSTVGDVWSWKTPAGVETFKRWNGSTWLDSTSNRRPAAYMGEFANTGALPTSGLVVGDLARLTDTNTVNVWNGVSWAVKTNLPAPIFAFIEQEKRARSDSASSEAGERNSLAVQLRGSYTGNDLSLVSSGLIYSERQARASAIGVQANRIDALSVSVDTPSTGLLARASSLESVTTNITSGNIALSNRSAALESTVNNGTTGVVATASALDTVKTLVNDGTNGVTATASRVSTLQSQVAGSTSSGLRSAIETEASTRASETGDLYAQYTVKLDVGGYVSGYGLASSGTSSEFIIRADRFALAPPAGSGLSTNIFPFVVQATSATINGVFVPAGVYMDAAYIINLSAMWARFGTLIADSIAAGQISAANLTVGDGTVGGNLKSTSFTAGSGSTPGTGWRLTPGGVVHASGAIIYGTIYASAGVFAGSLSAATGTFSGSLSAATGTFSGDISGASGTFSGNLNVAGSGPNRMEITTSRIKIFSGGVERVRLGDLS